jgi:hypothetical protein
MHFFFLLLLTPVALCSATNTTGSPYGANGTGWFNPSQPWYLRAGGGGGGGGGGGNGGGGGHGASGDILFPVANTLPTAAMDIDTIEALLTVAAIDFNISILDIDWSVEHVTSSFVIVAVPSLTGGAPKTCKDKGKAKEDTAHCSGCETEQPDVRLVSELPERVHAHVLHAHPSFDNKQKGTQLCALCVRKCQPSSFFGKRPACGPTPQPIPRKYPRLEAMNSTATPTPSRPLGSTDHTIPLPFIPFQQPSSAYEEFWNTEHIHVYSVYSAHSQHNRNLVVQERYQIVKEVSAIKREGTVRNHAKRLQLLLDSIQLEIRRALSTSQEIRQVAIDAATSVTNPSARLSVSQSRIFGVDVHWLSRLQQFQSLFATIPIPGRLQQVPSISWPSAQINSSSTPTSVITPIGSDGLPSSLYVFFDVSPTQIGGCHQRMKPWLPYAPAMVK